MLKGTASAVPHTLQTRSAASAAEVRSLKLRIPNHPTPNGLPHRRTAAFRKPALFPCLLPLLLLTSSALAQAGAGAPAGPAGPAGGSAAAPTAPAGTQPGVQTTGTPQSTASTYAVGASLGPDPRKPPPSRPGAFTLQQVIDQAQAKNPTLLAAQSNLRAVRAQELQAGVRANPYFTLYGTNLTEGEDANNPFLVSAQVSRLFERGQKRRFRLESAQATTAQTQAQLEDTVRQTVLSIKTAFTRMLVAKVALELSAASLKDYRHEVEIASDRFQAGDLGKLDFERLDLQLGSFESDASNDRVTLRQASAQLQTLMGIETPSPTFDIAGSLLPPVVTQTESQLVTAGLTNRPDYAATRYAIDAAEANSRLANANGTTDPTLEVEYDRNGPDNSVGASVNIPLRLFDRNQGNKSTARFQAEAATFTSSAARNQVVSDVAQAWVGYTEAKQLSDRFTTHYLDESSDVLSIAQFAFNHGGLALVDYLDALRDARTTTSDALNAYSNTWNSIHQLSAAASTELAP